MLESIYFGRMSEETRFLCMGYTRDLCSRSTSWFSRRTVHRADVIRKCQPGSHLWGANHGV